MPQADFSIVISIIFSLVNGCAICYSVLVVYLFYPFVSSIKVLYNLFGKAQHLKEILINFF
jgi:hypothetical protein